jgi:hypothetical protein
MILNGKFNFDLTITFDNIYEAVSFLREEFRGFKKCIKLWNENELIISMDVKDDEDEIYNLYDSITEKIEDPSKLLIEVTVTISKSKEIDLKENSKDLDVSTLIQIVRSSYEEIDNGMEHWNFISIFDSLKKPRV